MTYPIHPVAAIFPEMSDGEFAGLKADMGANGQQVRITLWHGQVIDGRNRLRACEELGIEPLTEDWTGDDPTSHVVSTNLHRRHLNEAQRGIVGAKLANMKHGGDRKSEDQVRNSDFDLSQQKAAEMLNVSRGSVIVAKKIMETGIPELVQAVANGKVSLDAAKQIASLNPVEQSEVVSQGPAAIKEKAATMRGKKPKRSRHDRRTGTHRASNDEVREATKTIEAFLAKWESLGGLKKLVRGWKLEERWTFCDTLEALAKILRRHSMDLRANQ